MKSTFASNIEAQSVLPNSHSKSIVFIDSGLDDYQTLAGGVLPGAEIIILDKMATESSKLLRNCKQLLLREEL